MSSSGVSSQIANVNLISACSSDMAGPPDSPSSKEGFADITTAITEAQTKLKARPKAFGMDYAASMMITDTIDREVRIILSTVGAMASRGVKKELIAIRVNELIVSLENNSLERERRLGYNNQRTVDTNTLADFGQRLRAVTLGDVATAAFAPAAAAGAGLAGGKMASVALKTNIGPAEGAVHSAFERFKVAGRTQSAAKRRVIDAGEAIRALEARGVNIYPKLVAALNDNKLVRELEHEAAKKAVSYAAKELEVVKATPIKASSRLTRVAAMGGAAAAAGAVGYVAAKAVSGLVGPVLGSSVAHAPELDSELPVERGHEPIMSFPEVW